MNKPYGFMYLRLYYWFELLIYGLGLHYSFMSTKHFMARSVMSIFYGVMGDGFSKMVTSILETEEKYSLWLSPQIFLIGSRLRTLSGLIFVGGKLKRLPAMRSVLAKRNLKEKINKFFEAAT